jgi:hypothetical protein
MNTIIKHHPKVKALMREEIREIPGGVEKLEAIAQFYGLRVQQKGFNYRLRIWLPKQKEVKNV